MPLHADLHGDVKTFFLAGVPHAWFGLGDDAEALVEAEGLTEEEALDAFGLSADAFAQGVLGARLKATVSTGPFRLDVHGALAVQTAGSSTSVTGFGTGVGQGAPELFDGTWTPDAGNAVTVQARIDRAVLSAKLPHVDVAVGRQPISFGVGRVFTPLDLVNPFPPTTIDPEYKPGVDAVRVDGFVGTGGKLTAAAAWAGSPIAGADATEPDDPLTDDLVLALAGQGTVGVTDLLGFAGYLRSEPVFGVGTTSSLGPVGIHGEATLTLPDGDDPFVRAEVGADGRPGEKTTLSGELYVQSFGATDPHDYLAELEEPRWQRGEVWALGQLYASVAVAQELTPLVSASASVIANVRDPSALLAVAGSWSVADDASLAFGVYAGLGEAPDEVDLDFAIDPTTLRPSLVPPTSTALADSVNSEFGLYPAMGFVQVRTYF